MRRIMRLEKWTKLHSQIEETACEEVEREKRVERVQKNSERESVL